MSVKLNDTGWYAYRVFVSLRLACPIWRETCVFMHTRFPFVSFKSWNSPDNDIGSMYHLTWVVCIHASHHRPIYMVCYVMCITISALILICICLIQCSRLEITPAMKLPVKPGAGFVFASAHHFLLSRAISSLLIICCSMTYQRTIYLSNDIITKGIQYVIETVTVISH